ncbi:mitochondrial 23S rRNA Cm2498 methyltransferase RlmM [Andalucia godoyi]|uniref:Mitochondrial 23S rRNA Cm2498 methyltransferase RlmM n=1 Tax=Andalucia godoyi TaxID=505711 RepID=A0A8K0AHL4_ANDGO|nr:mitochondrial 23S rRNA Cm2498 methyltransferase RlmM [Andalucia godoyi]|eukprot:ANDGO_06262.mRNA.1 mitochondrial 23S rRNA Cm2498 methyltransferase RlmM
MSILFARPLFVTSMQRTLPPGLTLVQSIAPGALLLASAGKPGGCASEIVSTAYCSPFVVGVMPDAQQVQGSSIAQLADEILFGQPDVLSKSRARCAKGSDGEMPFYQLHCFSSSYLQKPGQTTIERSVLGRRCELLSNAIRAKLRERTNWRYCRPDSRMTRGRDEVTPTYTLSVFMTDAEDVWVSCVNRSEWDASVALPQALRYPTFALGKPLLMDEFPQAPGSTYRKLEEAIRCLGARPSPGKRVVDLGASPGAWSVLLALKYGCHVTAVDRAPLEVSADVVASIVAGHEGEDRNGSLKFEKGDAFRFHDAAAQWLVWDVACDPRAAGEVLHKWASNPELSGLECIIANLKLRNDLDVGTSRRKEYWEAKQPRARDSSAPRKRVEDPPFLIRQDQAAAINDIRRDLVNHGWTVDVRHLWSAKHEVTLMATRSPPTAAAPSSTEDQ